MSLEKFEFVILGVTYTRLPRLNLLNYMLMQISNQQITRQHLNALRPKCQSSNGASEWQQGEFSDFECAMVVGVRLM